MIKSACACQKVQTYSVFCERDVTQYTNHTWLYLLILLLVDGSHKDLCYLHARNYQGSSPGFSLMKHHRRTLALIYGVLMLLGCERGH